MALGAFAKDLWQLQNAVMWFEQALLHPDLTESLRASCFLEIADSYVWDPNGDNNQAIEYAKMAVDLNSELSTKANGILAHAFLKTGDVRQADSCLSISSLGRDPETDFLRGLLCYRNGARIKANEIWKPLLTVRSENIRFHHIKQEILRFYFEKQPYLKAN
jgi:tetratricopeptide (TPR) repeat protein